jgi:hypothetical protein
MSKNPITINHNARCMYTVVLVFDTIEPLEYSHLLLPMSVVLTIIYRLNTLLHCHRVDVVLASLTRYTVNHSLSYNSTNECDPLNEEPYL